MKTGKILFQMIVFALIITSSCAPLQTSMTPTPDTGPVDYSQRGHWLSVPTVLDKPVDLFYLYPTAWMKVNADEPNICAIDNPIMLEGSASALGRQATAFQPVANIFAPYYRQVDAAYSLTLPLAEQDKILSGTPKSDVFAAFDYYIQNYNHGRPFILAGHSQGSNLLLYLLSEYMQEHPDVYARMVAAYVIGYSTTGSYLEQNPHLKFATGAGDTGVIISYNTQAPTAEKASPVLLPGAIAINPLTWTRDDTLATVQENLGSILPGDQAGFLVPVNNYADARVDLASGALICSTCNVDQLYQINPSFGKGIFHSFDYPLYYYNLRENAAQRVANYLKSHE